MKRLVCLLMLGCPAATAGTVYAVSALPFIATGINASGEIIGLATPNGEGIWPNAPKNASAIPQQAFIYSTGGSIDIGLAGATASTVGGLNDRGQVVGDSIIDGAAHPYLYSGGTIIDLTSALGNATLSGINDAGQIVGYSASGAAFDYDGGIMQFLNGGAIGQAANSSQPSSFRAGINTDGQIAASGAAPVNHFASLNGGPPCSATAGAFVNSGGKNQSVGMPFGCSNTFAVNINNNGQMLGQSVSGANNTGFVENLKTGVATLIPTLGGNINNVYAMNDDGEVVGNSNLCTDPHQQCYSEYVATLYVNGALVNVNNLIPTSSGWVFLDATGINDKGDIVGYGLLNGVLEGFLLTASDPSGAPEPGTWGLFLVGGAVAFFLRRRIAHSRPA